MSILPVLEHNKSLVNGWMNKSMDILMEWTLVVAWIDQSSSTPCAPFTSSSSPPFPIVKATLSYTCTALYFIAAAVIV